MKDKPKEKILKEFEEKLYKLSYTKENEIAWAMPEILKETSKALDTMREETAREIISLTEMTDEEMERIEEKYGFRLGSNDQC